MQAIESYRENPFLVWDACPSRPLDDAGAATTTTTETTTTDNQPGYWDRVWNNFTTTNEQIPGLVLPPLAGILTAGIVGQAFGLPTFGEALGAAAFRGALGGIEFAAYNAVYNFATTAVSFEAGILVGSMINEIPTPSGGTVGGSLSNVIFDTFSSQSTNQGN